MKRSKFSWLFVALFAYILLQSSWWMYSIYDLSQQVNPDSDMDRKFFMIFGEGGVFLLILIAGFWIVIRNYKKDIQLSNQQRNFLMSITHELKTPIASLKLYLQTLQKRNLAPEKQSEVLSNCVQDTERLNFMVESILVATKIDDNELVLEKSNFNLTELVKTSCYKLLETSAKKIEIDFILEDDVEFKGDQELMTSVINNLVENAIKYSPENGVVTVGLKQQDNLITFEVADQGVGIREAEKQNVFKKFYRVGDENTRKEKGTGLGLFIVKHIVTLHNGMISIENNSPKGAIFSCSFKQ